ncbi:hypothetical protein L6452_08846 [Arctium lappa]|uniref:Uncharacterized protein n=1 Tax=Arctium lappa TaxID=4217 RepID=A0ACB9DIV6_ARCLA|nr:hypothetical protein L6452_08846 [Arctium lappa]
MKMEEIGARDTLGDSALGTIVGHNRQQSGACGTVWAIVPWRKCLGHNRLRPLVVLEVLLEDSSFFKGAQSGVKSRFSLNLARAFWGGVLCNGHQGQLPLMVNLSRGRRGTWAAGREVSCDQRC